jgi:hypothetical protein
MYIFIFRVKTHKHIYGCLISCNLNRPPLHPGAQELEGTFSLAGTLLIGRLSLQVAQSFLQGVQNSYTVAASLVRAKIILKIKNVKIRKIWRQKNENRIN